MSQQVETRSPVPVQASPWWALPLGLVLFALVLLLVEQRYAAPPPKSEDAPAGEFSAGRARPVLRNLLGDGAPHPVGSAANARVRDRIVSALRRLGYEPEVQASLACNRSLICARVENIVARREGREPGAEVMLAAHYDSVPAGPGAADDLSGVAAILEIARILVSGSPPRHPIVLLISDGEEAGRLGADAFVAEHPLAKQVRAVVNLEARGSSGPSLMFQTSEDNGWLIPLYAGADRAVTSSSFQTIYYLLPHTTDFTTFRRAGMQGLNLAFVGDPVHYHTPLDNFANASPATLQHQGDNALAAIRALSEADLPERSRGDAVFFDVLSLGVIRWPAGWMLGIAGLAVLLMLGVVILLLRRGIASGRSLAWGLAAWLCILLACGVAGFGLSTILGMTGALRAPWAAHPFPFQAAFWSIALAAVGLVASLVSRRAGFLGMWAGLWLGWSVLGLLLAVSLPGASYLCVVPALAAALAGLTLVLSGPAWQVFAALLPAVLAAVLWFPLLTMLYAGMGSMILAGIAVLAGLVFSCLAPLVASPSRFWRRGIPLAAAVAAVILAGVAVSSPLFSVDSPEPMNLRFYQDADTGKARWIVRSGRPLPAALENAAHFGTEDVKAFPWSWRASSRVAEAPPLDAPGPDLWVLDDTAAGGRRRLRVRVKSLRGAPVANLILPGSARVESVTVQGHRVPTDGEGPSTDEWSLYNLRGVPPEGLEIELILGETAPQTWYVSDETLGLPSAGTALLRGRPATMAPSQEGDVTVIARQRRI